MYSFKLTLGVPVQSNKHVLRTYCVPGVLWGFGDMAEIEKLGLVPSGSFESDGKDGP